MAVLATEFLCCLVGKIHTHSMDYSCILSSLSSPSHSFSLMDISYIIEKVLNRLRLEPIKSAFQVKDAVQKLFALFLSYSLVKFYLDKVINFKRAVVNKMCLIRSLAFRCEF